MNRDVYQVVHAAFKGPQVSPGKLDVQRVSNRYLNRLSWAHLAPLPLLQLIGYLQLGTNLHFYLFI